MSRVTRSAFSRRSPSACGIGDFQRNRLAVDQPHPLDLAHRAALFHPQALGHPRAGRHVAQAVQAVDDLVAHLRHGLAQALQGC